MLGSIKDTMKLIQNTHDNIILNMNAPASYQISKELELNEFDIKIKRRNRKLQKKDRG